MAVIPWNLTIVGWELREVWSKLKFFALVGRHHPIFLSELYKNINIFIFLNYK